MPTVGLQAWAESGRAWGSLRGVWEEPGINLSGGFSKFLEPEPGVNCGLLEAFAGFWRLLEASGSFWKLLETSGVFGSLLEAWDDW